MPHRLLNKPWFQRVLNGSGNILIKISLLLAIFVCVLSLYERLVTPVTYNSVVIRTPSIYPGETLLVSIDFNKRRMCKSYYDRVILKPDGHVISTERYNGGTSNIGNNQTYLTQIKIPDNMAGGVYVLKYLLYHECELTSFMSTSPEAMFEVLNPYLKPR